MGRGSEAEPAALASMRSAFDTVGGLRAEVRHARAFRPTGSRGCQRGGVVLR